MDYESRLAELEIRLGFMDDLVETLSQVVARQQADIEQLRGELRVVYSQVRQLAPTDETDTGDEKPPHY